MNATGKGKMTPLLWAFPDGKLDRFKRLLKHGANPNVVVESGFNTRRQIKVGHSVTHLAAGTKFPGYFKEVMQNGGDADLRHGEKGDSLLHVVIKAGVPDQKERFEVHPTKAYLAV